MKSPEVYLKIVTVELRQRRTDRNFYISQQVVHGQYSGTNDEGKEYGAMEAIYEQVMYQDYKDWPYLDFGSSTEEQGSVINAGLIAHKEGYGGRGVVYDTYEWEV